MMITPQHIRTAELKGAALDWAVAKCENTDQNTDDDELIHIVTEGSGDSDGWVFQPSTDWAQGGPIIEREINKLWKNIGGTYGAQIKFRVPYYSPTYDADIGADAFINQHGPTPLIAAMRCFVASKLGNEIEIPQELV